MSLGKGVTLLWVLKAEDEGDGANVLEKRDKGWHAGDVGVQLIVFYFSHV